MSEKHKGKSLSTPIPQGRMGGGSARFREQVVKPKDYKGTIKGLWSYFRNERTLLAFIFIFVLLESTIVLLAPFLIGKAVDAISVINGVNFRLLKITIISLAIAYISSALLHFTQGWMMAGVSQRVVKSVRSHLFHKLQKLPISFFESRSHGEMMSRLTNDVDNVSSSISQSITQLMSGIIVIIGSLIMMIYLSPLLTLASLLTVPMIFLLTKTIAKNTRVLFREQQKELGKLNGVIEETISGQEIVKAFNHEKKSIAQFAKLNTELRKVSTKALIWSGFLMPMMNVINNIGFTIVAVIGGYLAVQHIITVGIIASFIIYSRQFVRPLNDLANIFNILQSGMAGAERVFEILDMEEEVQDDKDAIQLVNIKGVVEFKNVSFRYRDDIPILKNISFIAKPGSSTALIGATGAGKTTIVHLLTRFYDVTEGQILIDGIDIRKYTRDSLRNCFGFVLQDNYLFSGTILENIKYGNLSATEAEVKEAARLANADVFINRLPKGYETVLTENGGNLSHGQKQLLAIARVILSKPALLILDEATSSIDTLTEIQIQEALANVLKGRTSFIIAHRLNTIRDVDNIIVIHDGEIVEEGNHNVLMQKQGAYCEMISNQHELLRSN